MFKSRKLIVIIVLLLVIMVAVLGACGKEDAPLPPDDTTPPEQQNPVDDERDPDAEYDSSGNLLALSAPSGLRRTTDASLFYLWQEVNRAKEYRVELFFVSGGVSTLCHSAVVSQSEVDLGYLSYEFAEELFTEVGSYTISITAIANEGKNLDSTATTSPLYIAQGSFSWMPIEISTADELIDIASGPSLHYVLTADIDFDGAAIQPIGSALDSESVYSFSGSLDGRGHTISDFSIDRTAEPDTGYYTYVGLFSSIVDAEIRNLTIDKMYTYSPDDWYPTGVFVGSLAGLIRNSVLENVVIKSAHMDWLIYNNLSASQMYIGGLAGVIDSASSLVDCSVNADITAKIEVNPNPNAQPAQETEITGEGSTTIESGETGINTTPTYNSTITAGGIAGLLGDNSSGTSLTITRVSAIGKLSIKAIDYAIGGLAGNVSPDSSTPTIAQSSGAVITDSYANVALSAAMVISPTSGDHYSRYIGLLVGKSNALSIERAYSSSTIAISYTEGSDDSAYMKSSTPVVGFLTTTSVNNKSTIARSVKDCYYLDTSLSSVKLGTTESAPAYNGGVLNYSGIAALNAEQLSSQLSYTNTWDFENVWTISGGKPTLK